MDTSNIVLTDEDFEKYAGMSEKRMLELKAADMKNLEKRKQRQAMRGWVDRLNVQSQLVTVVDSFYENRPLPDTRLTSEATAYMVRMQFGQSDCNGNLYEDVITGVKKDTEEFQRIKMFTSPCTAITTVDFTAWAYIKRELEAFTVKLYGDLDNRKKQAQWSGGTGFTAAKKRMQSMKTLKKLEIEEAGYERKVEEKKHKLETTTDSTR